MSEVAVAFPSEEASGEVIASRLRAAGIPARVDRGLHASWQVAGRGQITVFVEERDVKRAIEILGPQRLAGGPPERVLQVAIVVVAALIAFGVLAMLASRLGR